MEKYLFTTDIYLPDTQRIDMKKWPCVACDQYTSEREYWTEIEKEIGDAPSTLSLMLPEAYLSESDARIPRINERMRQYLSDGTLVCHENCMIYLERTQSDGRVRRGIVGAVDLEQYDFNKGSKTLIRATEGTVLDRIPPRVEIRRGAELEMPHIMILIDDPDRTVIEPVAAKADTYTTAYDTDLLGGGGHARGYFIDEDVADGINKALAALATREKMREKYNYDGEPLLFAMGDGNHSLASAKAMYDEIKAQIGESAAREHPARYALCEIVNLHDDALDFEPIYRVMFGVDPEDFAERFESYLGALEGKADPQSFCIAFGGEKRDAVAAKPLYQLAVGTAQEFIDGYISEHEGATVDYVHGQQSALALSQKEGTVAILFEGMSKDALFKTVLFDGALPRKTFSMGHAADKRYYMECRRI